jgi:hypothetical protein
MGLADHQAGEQGKVKTGGFLHAFLRLSGLLLPAFLETLTRPGLAG